MKIDPMNYGDAENYCANKGMVIVGEGNLPNALAQEAKYFGIASHWIRGGNGNNCVMKNSPHGDHVQTFNCSHAFDVICHNENYNPIY